MNVPPELIHGFFQCISSDGTLKSNPATIHHDLINCSQNTRLNSLILGLPLENSHPRQQKFRAMNGAHLASPIRGELGYAHWPQLGTQFIALLRMGTKFGAHYGNKMFALTLP